MFVIGGATLALAQAVLFNSAPPVAVGEGSGHLVLADVNRDGKPDLLAQHLQQHVVTVHLGDGTGGFTPTPGSPVKLAYAPGDIKVGDLNGDGNPDLGITRSESDSVDVLLGDGSGKFNRAPSSPVQVSAAKEFNTHGLQFLGLNEDGKLDLLTTSNQRNSFAALFGNGRGGFTPGATASQRFRLPDEFQPCRCAHRGFVRRRSRLHRNWRW